MPIVEPFGSGLINETYRNLVFDGDSTRSYVHQKINAHVFPHSEQVIENMALVTGHIREKLQQDRSNRRKTTLELIPAHDGRLYYLDNEGEYWRTTLFIPNTLAYDTVQNPHQAREAGRILGEFQRFVADIPPDKLHDTLPGFHHTPLYYERFLQCLESSHPDARIEARRREPEALELIEQLKRRATLVPRLMSAYQEGTLRERVVHNDPKLNNILFDADSERGICIIDLDTVKNGLIQFDYGDCLRTVANPLGEETRNIRDVYFDIPNFEALTEGYLAEALSFLTEADLAYLVDSIEVIVLEQAVRFLHDYLQGDLYYKPAYPAQNLNRALVQFALLQDLEKKDIELRRIISLLAAKDNMGKFTTDWQPSLLTEEVVALGEWWYEDQVCHKAELVKQKFDYTSKDLVELDNILGAPEIDYIDYSISDEGVIYFWRFTQKDGAQFFSPAFSTYFTAREHLSTYDGRREIDWLT